MSVGVKQDWLVCFPCWNPQSPWKKRKLLVYACTSKGKMAFSLIFVYTTCSSRCRTCPSQGLRYRRQAVSWGYLDQSQLARAQSQWQLGQMWPPRWCLTSQSPENTMLETSPNVPKFLLQGDFKEVLKIVPKKNKRSCWHLSPWRLWLLMKMKNISMTAFTPKKLWPGDQNCSPFCTFSSVPNMFSK